MMGHGVLHRVKRDYIYVKRDLYTCRKKRSYREARSMTRQDEARGSQSFTSSKEAYMFVKRDLYTCRKRCTNRVARSMTRHDEARGSQSPTSSKETYVFVKRDLYTCRKKPSYRVARSMTRQDEAKGSCLHLRTTIILCTRANLYSCVIEKRKERMCVCVCSVCVRGRTCI